MTRTAAPTQAIVWTDAAGAPLVERVLGYQSDVAVAAVGGPRKGDLSDLAGRLVIDEVADDLRQMIINAGERDVDLLLATQQGVKLDDIRLALDSGVDVLTLEPLTTQADRALLSTEPTTKAGWLWLTPLLRFSPGYLAAVQPQEALGPIRSIGLSSTAAPGTVSLLARLVDCLDMLIAWLGVPVTIDAAWTGPLTEAPDDLRGITGHLAMNVHFADNVAAAVQISDRAAVTRRSMTVIGEDGTLLLDDDRYRLFTADGEQLDATETDRTHHADLAELIAHQWRHLLTTRPTGKQPDPRAILGCCEAAMLSARTGQAESTETLVRMKM